MSELSSNSPSQEKVEQPTHVYAREALIRKYLGDSLCDSDSFTVVFSDPDMRSVYINPVAVHMLDPNSILGKQGLEFSLRDLISVTEANRFDSSIFPLLLVTGRWAGRIEMCSLWGSSLVMECELRRFSLKGDSGGKFLCLLAHLSDDATLVAANQAKDRDYLLALLGHTDDAIYFKDKESRFLRVSLSLTRRFGLKNPSELIGRTDFEFFDMDHALVSFEDEKRILETGKPMLDKEEREIWEDGRVTWASTSKLPLLDSDGNVIGTVGVSRDITERKLGEETRQELESKLQLAQRLEAIGSLAAGVAHEINTPTQFVSDNVRFLGEAFGDMVKLMDGYRTLCEKMEGRLLDESDFEALKKQSEEVEYVYLKSEIPDTIKQTLEGLSQISRIVGSLKEFSYPSSSKKVKADLNRAIENTINIARNEWKYVADVKRDFDPSMPEIPCLVDEINQSVLNLLVNAAHAIEDADRGKGSITIRTYTKGSNACIEVKDTGNGIPEKHQDRLFDPFFTTKKVGRGTGQGLPMVQSVVVNNHGGQVEFDTEIGVGTTFRLILPLDGAEGEDNSSVNDSSE